MDTKTWLGKITKAELGYGGYQDAQFGFCFEISGAFGCGDFWGCFANKDSETEEVLIFLGGEMMRVKELLRDAQVSKLSDLAGKPVEVTTDGTCMLSWCILTEVL